MKLFIGLEGVLDQLLVYFASPAGTSWFVLSGCLALP